FFFLLMSLLLLICGSYLILQYSPSLSLNLMAVAPPPPPPLPPAGWVKNCRQAENNDKNEKTSGSIASENSSRTEPKKGQSKSPVQQLSLNFADSPLFKQKQAADEGSNTGQGEPNRTSTPKSASSRVLSPQQDNDNQHSGVQFDKDKPGEMKCESKNQKSSVAEQKKATGLKYSIAILLLCTSGAVAGVYTYFMISAVLSGASVPVFFAVIASVSALVMFSSAAYLINSFVSAINSEKGVDPGRKQPQNLQKAKGLEHSNSANTPTSSLPVMSGTPSAPPSPPPPPPLMPVKPNTEPGLTRKSSLSDTNQKDMQQKQSDTPVDNLLAEIKKGTTLKQVSDEQKKNYLPEDGKQESNVQLRNTGAHQVRKVESQKTDKEPSNSEGIQQMDSLAIAIQKQRGRSGFQNAQLDSLDEQEDSLFYLEEKSFTEQNKTVNQGQKNCVQKPDIGLILYNALSTTLSTESPINNLSSNSGNAPDYGDWDTQPQSIPYIYCDRTRQERRQEKKEKGASPSATKGNGADQVSNEVQESSTVSVQKIRKRFE
ncbi:MAG: hypothetical protein ACEY3K_08825, partial [Wolbachia sp.]